ncbi:hypothetical protein [Nocardiopsis alba]|uniref:hypothetical protein n=1 Tax=Nocardiopsis alba TaxID=53437 RepID=UPI0033AECA30
MTNNENSRREQTDPADLNVIVQDPATPDAKNEQPQTEQPGLSTSQEAAPPAPVPGTVVEEPSSWNDPVRLIAGVITAASAITTVWALWDLISADGTDPAAHLVGLAAGLVVEGGWLLVLASNYQAAAREGAVARWRTIVGWTLAGGAALLLGYHGIAAGSLAWSLLGLLPLISKTAWHVLTHARARQARQALQERRARERAAAEAARAQAEQDRALSTELTPEQEAELAALEREAAYVTAKTERELALDAARAQSEQQRALAEIRRQAERQMAVDEGAADIEVQRAELRNRIRLASPVYTVTELPAGGHHDQVPTDPSGFGIPPTSGSVAGFGAGMEQARQGGGGIGRQGGGIAADLHGRPSPTVESGGIGGQGGGIAADQAERAPHHAARVSAGQETRQRVLEEIRYAGVEITNAELSRLLEIGRTTVRDHRNALRDAGYTVYPDSK